MLSEPADGSETDRLDDLADETASALGSDMKRLPSRTLVMLFGDHGFALDPLGGGTTRAPRRSSGCSSDPSRGRESTSGRETGAALGKIRIAASDDYVRKVGRCISEHAPDDKKKALVVDLLRTQAWWTARAANSGTRPSLDQSYGLALTSIKVSFAWLSCEW